MSRFWACEEYASWFKAIALLFLWETSVSKLIISSINPSVTVSNNIYILICYGYCSYVYYIYINITIFIITRSHRVMSTIQGGSCSASTYCDSVKCMWRYCEMYWCNSLMLILVLGVVLAMSALNPADCACNGVDCDACTRWRLPTEALPS